MFSEEKFQEIFGDTKTQYQQGQKDAFEGKGKQSNNPDYLKGYVAQVNLEGAGAKANG